MDFAEFTESWQNPQTVYFPGLHVSGHRYIPNNSDGKYIFLTTSGLVSIATDDFVWTQTQRQ